MSGKSRTHVIVFYAARFSDRSPPEYSSTQKFRTIMAAAPGEKMPSRFETMFYYHRCESENRPLVHNLVAA